MEKKLRNPITEEELKSVNFNSNSKQCDMALSLSDNSKENIEAVVGQSGANKRLGLVDRAIEIVPSIVPSVDDVIEQKLVNGNQNLDLQPFDISCVSKANSNTAEIGILSSFDKTQLKKPFSNKLCKTNDDYYRYLNVDQFRETIGLPTRRRVNEWFVGWSWRH